MANVARTENINVLTLSEIESISGYPRNWKVKIKRNPRYVNEEKCTGCGLCTQNCPIKTPNEYNEYFDNKSAIYVPFPQAVPLVYKIDSAHCLYFQYGICQICQKICPADAVNFDEKETSFEIQVGSIIMATGFDEFDPSQLKQFGYGIYPNVITSLQYERLLHPTGPSNGKIVRPSDGNVPQSILWVQCVGSRSAKEGNEFCNRVCCMWALKQARAYKLQVDEGKADICYIDMRTTGKLYEEYYRQTKEKYDVNFIRGKVAEIQENAKTRNLIVWNEDTDTGEISEIRDTDLVVLNCSFVPSKGTIDLCTLLGIDIGVDGFPQQLNSYHPIETSQPGIFLAGVATGSKDAVDTVTQARAAASSAISFLDIRLPYIEPSIPETELDISGETRLGVFVCHCGGNISNYTDVPEVIDYAKTLPSVVYAAQDLFFCSEPGQASIKEAIKENDLNRVIVASCSPLLHEPTFRQAVEEAGLNKYLFEMVNLRDQSSQVHIQTPEEATEKAKDLIRAGISRALHLEIVPYRTVEVINEALVIGGGIAGMSTALDLSQQRFNVHIIEKEAQLGGRLNSLYKIAPELVEADQIVDELTSQILQSTNISIYLEASLASLDGHIGNFLAQIRTKNGAEVAVNVGAIILAVGTKIYTPNEGEYGYNSIKDVVTSLEFEQMLKDKSINPDPKRVVFIQCVGSREKDGNVHCSRVCCGASMKNAQAVKELFPECQTFILYKEDLRPAGRYMEEFYLTTRKKYRTNFMRWIEDKPPVVSKGQDGNVVVQVYDTLSRTAFEIDADYVVLAVGQEPPEDFEDICKMTGVTRSADGFIEPVHIKFKPVETRKDGIYLAGAILSPRSIGDSIALGKAAASASGVLLRQKELQLELIKAVCDQDLCSGCAICVAACPYDAIYLEEKEEGKLVSATDEIECKGCGMCVAACPSSARELRYWRDEQFYPQIEAMLQSRKSLLLVFACEKCGYGAADLAGLSKLQYDHRVRIIRVPCTGRVDTAWILNALSQGADGVAVVG